MESYLVSIVSLMNPITRRWDTSISAVTRLWAGRSGVQIPSGIRDFMFL